MALKENGMGGFCYGIKMWAVLSVIHFVWREEWSEVKDKHKNDLASSSGVWKEQDWMTG